MITIPAALDLLAEQGDPDRIAAYLHARGIRAASPLAPPSAGCPVAQYVRAVSHPRARVGSTEWMVLNENASGPLPPAVREFIRRFDRGAYPELTS